VVSISKQTVSVDMASCSRDEWVDDNAFLLFLDPPIVRLS